jgi:uncharacterized protein (DUF58 family)
MTRVDVRRLPLTSFGLAVLGIGAVCYVVGWQLGWVELMVVAAACFAVLVLSVPFVVGRSRLQLSRTIEPPRVTVGERCVARLTARNTARTSMRAVRVVETTSSAADAGGDAAEAPLAALRDRHQRRIELDVPRLGPGAEHVVEYALPTDRRGAIEVGPAVVSRADPAGMLSREVAHTGAEVLWVHPRWRLVRPLAAGFAKDLEGPTADDSPAGDVAFHAVRPYHMGDDPRHVHWMSTARAGEVMVRHYVDNRRPHLTVVVDAAPDGWGGAEFETAVEVAASLTVSSMRHRLPVAAVVGREWIVGRTRAGDLELALDRFTVCQPATGRVLLLDVADALAREPATSAIVVVVARTPVEQLLRCVQHARRRARVIVVDCRADENGVAAQVPGARTVRARDLASFATAWDRGLAR